MIFDKLATFKQVKSIYDPTSGTNKETVLNTQSILANVTDTGTTRAVQVFGDIKSQSKVLRLNDLPDFDWSYVEVDGVKYIGVTDRQPLKAKTLIVSETNEFE